jgi:hypothetical protein
MPMGACVLFGLYMMAKLVSGVGSFSSYPDEAAMLHQVRLGAERARLPGEAAS